MLNKLLNRRVNNEKVNRFNKIIEFAKSVIEETKEGQKENKSVPIPHPLIDVIRLLGRGLQARHLTQLLFEEEETSLLPRHLCPETVLFSRDNLLSVIGKTFEDFKVPVKTIREIHLGRDLVLPWPWHRTRLINTISRIGEGRLFGSWEQDDNHEIELWLPLGIAWVDSGNHSIATGIIQCSGTIISDCVYDISKMYDYVHCNGKDYISAQSNEIIAPVENVEFAAIFEIGRLMKNNSISF